MARDRPHQPQKSMHSSASPAPLMPKEAQIDPHLDSTPTVIYPCMRTGARTGLGLHTRGLAFRIRGHQPFFCQPDAPPPATL